VLEGIPVARHSGLQEFHAALTRAGTERQALRAGMQWSAGGTRIRVLHPPEPDWERPAVRNDDSVVIEAVLGDVAMLLTGDIGAEVERRIAPQLTPARIRILKVAHHGSRTSSSAALLDSWRPQYALISAGRGNRFGHPAPDVLRRLEAISARVYRTDRDGQITISTDGNGISIHTFVGGRLETR
jgi:competence protein ComEC